MAMTVTQAMKDFLYDVSDSIGKLDFFNKVVEFDDDPNSLASSEASFIFTGPPILNPGKGALKQWWDEKNGGVAKWMHPVGAVQQFAVNDGSQVIPFGEVGSRLWRHCVGKTNYSANMARVLTTHDNITYAFYGWLYNALSDHQLNLRRLPNATDSDSSGKNTDGSKPAYPVNYNHFIGMESEIFRIPVGILLITGNAAGQIISCEYHERCLIQGKNKAYTSGNTMVIENVAIMIGRTIPFLQDGMNVPIGASSLIGDTFISYQIPNPATV